MVQAPNLSMLPWLRHGFGQKDSIYPDGITTLHQIHSCVALCVSGDGGDRIAEGDAALTDQAGMLVGVRTADCVPILIADPRNRAVAAVHAGWRGTAASIVLTVVRMMEAQFASVPRELIAAVGPSIGACCYQVGPDVAHQFEPWLSEMNQEREECMLDLKRINALQMSGTGINNIWISNDCTFCSRQYWSFRREREQAGRMISFIGAI